MEYPVETFTAAEAARLAPHVTNLDGPVFALVNLPETVKGALFARYSRYQGTLRRLFLDEFADSLPDAGGAAFDGAEGERAAQLYERIFVGYGDDSVAQLGGAHIACEWVSNVLTKVLQRPRLGAYLEQSTRYIAYDAPMPGGGYRYYRDPQLGPGVRDRDGRALRHLRRGAAARARRGSTGQFARAEGESEAAHARACQAKALDLLRGLLPAASLSHMGIFATGQTYEQLILHLLAHPLPEARHYGRMILDTLKAGDAELRLARRAPRPRRRVGRLPRGARGGGAAAGPRGSASTASPARSPTADRRCGCCTSTATRTRCWPRCCSRPRARPRRSRAPAWRPCRRDERRELLRDLLVGERRNRRHRPGRGFEALRYRFEIVTDYGAFRDLQRHRMLTVQWQRLAPHLGAGVPDELEAAGVAGRVPPRARRLRTPSGSAWPPTAARARRSTRSASATASASSWTSTRARRCSSSSCAPAARATRATARSRTRCTGRSSRSTRPSRAR